MKLYVVGIGPGGVEQMTARAVRAIEGCQVVAGYAPYLEQIAPLCEGKTLLSTGMRGEVERCRMAVEAALAGRRVAVVSGGDAGVYGMAGLVHQLAAEHPQLEVEVVPGVTAACAAAAVLGAPIGHDFAVISLSDLLTEWELIERRLRLAAQAGFILCIYNPSSKKRADTLRRACRIVMECRDAATPCGMVRDAGRPGEYSRLLTLGELAETPADMSTTVIIGNSATRRMGGRLVTPRGYAL